VLPSVIVFEFQDFSTFLMKTTTTAKTSSPRRERDGIIVAGAKVKNNGLPKVHFTGRLDVILRVSPPPTLHGSSRTTYTRMYTI